MTVRKLHSAALEIDAEQYLAGWRAEAGVLFLPALSTRRIGDEVAVRVGVSGQTIRATVFGVVSMVRRVGRPSLPPGVELKLDQTSLPAARFLALAARGETVTFRERAPRYVTARELRVTCAGREHEAVTRNVSEGGCALEWSGSPLASGEVLLVRLGGGLFASRVRGVVCWTSGGRRSVLGVRLVLDGRALRAWRGVVAEAARARGGQAV